MQKLCLFTMLVAILFLLPGYSYVENRKIINGIIKDSTNGTAIPNVLIQDEQFVSETYSDHFGNFTIEIPITAKVIKISKKGYDNKVISIGDQTNLIITLTPLQQQDAEPLTGLSWSAPFIFWGGLAVIALSFWLIKRNSTNYE